MATVKQLIEALEQLKAEKLITDDTIVIVDCYETIVFHNTPEYLNLDSDVLIQRNNQIDDDYDPPYGSYPEEQ